MRTELPADRAQRRLGSDTANGDAERSEDEEPDTSLSRWLPDAPTTGGPSWVAAIRADPGRAGVVALAAVGVIAVLVTVFTLVRDDPPPVVSAKLPPVQMVSSTSPTAGSPAPEPDGPVVVSVVGLVHRPGLVTLTSGARIADALTAAGGTLDGADLIGLNMARPVSDGEQIVVGIASPPGAPSSMGSSITAPPGQSPAPGGDGGAAPPGLVNLNTATPEELDALPGVGPVTASAIVGWRDANGRFTTVEQLGEVDGIGPARLEKLRDLVHV
ncbi:MAG: competence protein ComEA [Mycobacterium sp.]|jgi:competence protein ComEA|nr:competence protein ComEA [Mycobacterium sp.]